MKISVLSILRIIALPLIVFFYLAGGLIPDGYGKLVALALFIIVAATDMISVQTSPVDKTCARIINKTLRLVGLLLVLTDFDILVGGYRPTGSFLPMPLWFAIIALVAVFASEIVIDVLRFAGAKKNVEIVPDKNEKAKTVTQYIATGLLMFYAVAVAHNYFGLEPIGTVVQIYEFAALFALAVATVLSIVSAGNYLYRHRELYLGKREKKDWGEK